MLNTIRSKFYSIRYYFPYIVLLIILICISFIHIKQTADLPYVYYNDEAHMLNPALKMASDIFANPAELKGTNTGARVILSYCPGYKYFLAYNYIAILPIVHFINNSVNINNLYLFPYHFIYFSRLLNFLFLFLIGIFLIKISKLLTLNNGLSVILLLLFFGNRTVILSATVAKAELATTTLITISFYYYLKYLNYKELKYFILTILLASFAALFKLTVLSASLVLIGFSLYLFFSTKQINGKLSKPVQFGIILLIIIIILFIYMPHYFLNIKSVLSNLDSDKKIFSKFTKGYSQIKLLILSINNINNFNYKLLLPAVLLSPFLLFKNKNIFLQMSVVPFTIGFHILFMKNGLFKASWTHYILPIFPMTIVFIVYTYYQLFQELKRRFTKINSNDLLQRIIIIIAFLIPAGILIFNVTTTKKIILENVTNFYKKNEKNLFYISNNVPLGSNILKFRVQTPPINPLLFNINIAGTPTQIRKLENNRNNIFYLIIDPTNASKTNKNKYFLITYQKLDHAGYNLDGYFMLSNKEKVHIYLNPYSYSANQWELNNLNNIWVDYLPVELPLGFRQWRIIWEKEIKTTKPEKNAYMTYIPIYRLKKPDGKISICVNEKSKLNNPQKIDITIIYQNISSIHLIEEKITWLPYYKNITLNADSLSIANVLVIVKGENLTKNNLQQYLDISIK